MSWQAMCASGRGGSYSLDSFDFNAQPSLNKALVLELARWEWIEKRRNRIAPGSPGISKIYIGLAQRLIAFRLNSLIGFAWNGQIKIHPTQAGLKQGVKSNVWIRRKRGKRSLVERTH
jgi:hypothetical protein